MSCVGFLAFPYDDPCDVDQFRFVFLRPFVVDNNLTALRFLNDINPLIVPVLLSCILYYSIVPPGQKMSFQAGFRPDFSRESLKIGPPAAEGRPEDRF